jgi:hypothetical protein
LRHAAGFDFDVITDDPGKPAAPVPPATTTEREIHRRDLDRPWGDDTAAAQTKVRDG